MAVPRAAYNNMKSAFPIGTRKMLSNLAEEAVRVGPPLSAGQRDKAKQNLGPLVRQGFGWEPVGYLCYLCCLHASTLQHTCRIQLVASETSV